MPASPAREPFAMVPLPSARSRTKPRETGLTMMMDWGLPLGQQGDWLELLAPNVDLAKFVVENVVFRNIELRTVNRWGMQR